MPGTGNSISVRTAGARDAALLASLGEATFRESWARFNDPADMAAYCLANFTTGLLEADLARPGVRYLIAESGAEAAGYLRLAAEAAPACVIAARPVEISRLYSLRSWHGRGVGPVLMTAGLRDARVAGHDVAWLAVWQRAPQPLAFYRKWGFEVVGTTRFHLGRDVQEDFVMTRPL
jgi:GNAT superfamily N-acetyltransferase